MSFTRLLVGSFVSISLLAGCGGDDDATATQTVAAPAATPTVVQTVAGVSTAAATPAPHTYTVKAGDTLSEIAAQFNTTVEVLTELNSLDNSNRIFVGQELKLP